MDIHHLNRIAHDFGFIMRSLREGSYVTVFIMSMLVGYVLPVPEVVVLILAGFAAATGALKLSVVLAVTYLGILTGDVLIYTLARLGSRAVQRFNQKIRLSKLFQYEQIALSNITATIYFLRFFVGFRFFGPVFSGTFGAERKKFIFASAGASLLHTVLFVLLGYYFSHQVWLLITQAEIMKYALMAISPFAAGALIAWQRRRQ